MSEKRKFDLVVTRHPALVTFLKEMGLITGNEPVIGHVTDPSILVGQNVIGVMPNHLSSLCASITEVPLVLPPELRGKELTTDQVRAHAGAPVTYRVRKI